MMQIHFVFLILNYPLKHHLEVFMAITNEIVNPCKSTWIYCTFILTLPPYLCYCIFIMFPISPLAQQLIFI